MSAYFRVEDLTVGYNGVPLIRDITFELEKGAILTLIGPNGAGKSTILKTITRHLPALGGQVLVAGEPIAGWTPKELARRVAVMLTDHVRPELMTVAELVAMGRYPYTDLFGRMTPEDRAAVEDALRRVHALDLAQREFSTLSDGQRQRCLLARAICQQPEIIVLDEPTAYLDIRHKVELLDILREMAMEKGITVLMSLHEIDLATKISDRLLCVKGETITAFGPPDQILRQCAIERLYEMSDGAYDPLFGSVELGRAAGAPEVFIVAGGGRGIPFYRALQKRRVPFAAGVLFENDVDHQVAAALSDHVVTAPAFSPVPEDCYVAAAALLTSCRAVVDAGTPVGEYNRVNQRLLDLAREKGIPVLTELP